MTTAPLQLDALSTLVELLRWRAAHQPDQHIYTFLSDGESTAQTLTAAQLDLQARTIAAQLQAANLSGQRALLLFPPGLEYIAAFFGCLYAGVVAVPAYPPPANKPPLRLQAILANARATVALTTTTTFTKLEPQLANAPELRSLHWIEIDTLAQQADSWHAPDVDATTLAFLQYTSGSTASPKGVVLSHGNLLHNLGQIYRCFGHSAQSQGVIWLPPYHDMGLIGGILQPLYGGFPVTLMAPVAFLQSPIRWLQAISRDRATTSGGPNFAYELCARKITAEQRATLDLSSWEVAFTGAEPIRSETLDLFAATFAECGFRREAFYPCYGLAEATLIVTGGALHAPPVVQTIVSAELEQNRVQPAGAGPPTQTLVGSGQNLRDQRLAIVDPHTRRACQPDEVGEIWVAGTSVAQGYWEQPELTAETFQARLADDQSGPFLRTGDLGFLHAGELFVTGRLKDLIIIRGRNHYPQDIELTVAQSHPALRPSSGAAFSIDVQGEERLVIVQEVERQHRKTDPTAIVDAIRAAVATQHDVQVYAVVLLRPGGIPKTSSGKIQRHACRSGFLANTLDVLSSDVLPDTAPLAEEITLTRNMLLMLPDSERPAAISAYLQQRIKQVVRSSAQQLDPQQSLSALGIDSLQAVEIATLLEVDLAVVLPMAQLLEGPSIAQLTAELLRQLAAPAALLEPSDVASDHTSLSYGQRALWFLHRLAPASAAYNIVGAVRTSTPLQITALAQAIQQLSARHPALRTTFGLQAAALQPEPIRHIHAELRIPLHEVDATAWDAATLNSYLNQAAQQPFDLQHGPLLRLSLVTCAAQQQILLLAMHHIVTDFWSMAVLVDELGQLYAAARDNHAIALPPLSHDYGSYVQWQRELLQSSSGAQQWNYWQHQLGGPLPVLDLPSDRPRPPIQTDRGATETLHLNAELHRRLLRLSEAHGVTLYMTLLAAFQVLLARYSGQTDILVGSTTSGRNRAWLAPLVGYFVNPVVLRSNLAHNPTFATLLRQVRQTVLDAFAHQDYPFPLLVERLQPQRDPARSPIFQVLFTFHQGPRLDTHSLSGLALGREGTQLKFG
ncbi:MAG: AMP-binding protein, partial [Chloroflexi bacterium]|nr:AMP-binding protein [Chloroflexota bacterium]